MSNSNSDPGLARRNVTQFVEDQQVLFGQLHSQSQQLPFLTCFQQQRNQLRHPEEANTFTLATRSDSQCSGDVRLASTTGADQQEYSHERPGSRHASTPTPGAY